MFVGATEAGAGSLTEMGSGICLPEDPGLVGEGAPPRLLQDRHVGLPGVFHSGGLQGGSSQAMIFADDVGRLRALQLCGPLGGCLHGLSHRSAYARWR